MEPARRRLAHLSRARSGLCVAERRGAHRRDHGDIALWRRASRWISMVLVAGEYRRRGLATRLMRRAMDDLARDGPHRHSRCHARRARRLPQRSASRIPGAFNGFIRRERAARRHRRAPRRTSACARSPMPIGRHCALRRRGLRRRARRHAGRPARTTCPPPSSSPSARAASPASCSAATACERAHLCPLIADDDAVALRASRARARVRSTVRCSSISPTSKTVAAQTFSKRAASPPCGRSRACCTGRRRASTTRRGPAP